MKDIEPTETEPTKLLEAGRAPFLLTTRIVPASVITKTDGAKTTGRTTVKLLGVIKGVVIAAAPVRRVPLVVL